MSENEKNTTAESTGSKSPDMKFCSECGKEIAKKAVVCPHCGCQVDSMAKEQPSIVINNSNQNSNQNSNAGGVVDGRKAKNKWTALVLLIFLGFFGAHKFYEDKIGMGVLYIFTGGLCGIGVIVDFWVLLFKPNPYYVN